MLDVDFIARTELIWIINSVKMVFKQFSLSLKNSHFKSSFIPSFISSFIHSFISPVGIEYLPPQNMAAISHRPAKFFHSFDSMSNIKVDLVATFMSMVNHRVIIKARRCIAFFTLVKIWTKNYSFNTKPVTVSRRLITRNAWRYERKILNEKAKDFEMTKTRWTLY